jgi:hypothetical protein
MFDDDEAKKEAHRAETASNRLRELLMHASANGEAIALANGCKVEAEEAMATLEAGQEFVYRRQVLNARSRFPADTYAAVANFLPDGGHSTEARTRRARVCLERADCDDGFQRHPLRLWAYSPKTLRL